MITPVIVKKEKDGIYVVNDDRFRIAFRSSDDKLFLEQANAIRYEKKLMDNEKPDDKSAA